MQLQLFIKTCLLIGFTFTSTVNPLTAQNYEFKSPNKELELTVNIGEQVSFSVTNKGLHVMKAAKIALELDNGNVLGNSPKLKKKKLELIDETIKVQVPYKDVSIESVYNQLSLSFSGNFKIIFRAYNDGIAYRFVDGNTKTTVVTSEDMKLVFPENSMSYFPQEKSMYSDNERLYIRTPISEIKKGDFCHLPVMFDTG
jgi:alpha-glucosidase